MSSAAANQPFVFTPTAAPVAGVATDPLVHNTRREIAEIVREVAGAVRSNRSEDEFLTLLVDRILRAMAAEGVIVWIRQESGPMAYKCVKRLGRLTDQAIPPASRATHHRLITEIAAEGQPVVVPSTPGATDPEVAANPMQVSVAVVPVECDPASNGSDYLLEVFLESDCGVATQRGYLRFVAQMADLAGEFLRADQLRRLRREQIRSREVDAAIAQLHDIQDLKQLFAAIVDGAAELFGFDRVGLCRLEPSTSLEAVSHVNTIDTKSSSARQLCEAAMIEVEVDGCTWIEEPSCESSDADTLIVRAVVSSNAQLERSLVCLQVCDADAISPECRSELVRYMQHAELALQNVSRLAAIPGGRVIAALAPAIQNRHRGWKPIAISVVVMTLLIVIALFPVPLVVYSTASVRPAMVQTLSAPRDAVVDQIHVRHGQSVFVGEKLLTLSDPTLEEQITELIGQRAVLVQKRAHWTATLVDSASTRLDRLEQVQGEQSLVMEQIQSIDDQLAVLQRVKDSLVIRAGRNGIVDAWQIEQRLQSRPLRRGDLLLQVIAEDSPWVVDAQVPQSRIGHVQNAELAENLSARVSLEANPNESLDASLQQIGPAVTNGPDAAPATAVLLRLSVQASHTIAARQGLSHQSGAPARVMFHCGQTPAAYLLFQDVIRSVRGNLALYIASEPENTGTMGDGE